MSVGKIDVRQGSAAVGGSNSGNIVAVTAAPNSQVSLQFGHKIDQELPSFLGDVLVFFAKEGLSQYGRGPRRSLPPEVEEKLDYNHLDRNDSLFDTYRRYVRMLESAYQSVEQYNSDARHLVHFKAARAYAEIVLDGCKASGIKSSMKLQFVRENASAILGQTVKSLLDAYKSSGGPRVQEEWAHFAITLVVVDAVVECEVLERPPDAVTT